MKSKGVEGLTIIDVLATITIISILTAFLMGSIGASYEKAKQAQCIYNQHQLVDAILLYALDEDRFPSEISKVLKNYINPTYQEQNYLVGWFDHNHVYASVVSNYYNNEGALLKCPKVDGTEFDNPPIYSYGYNTLVKNSNYSAIRENSKIVVIADSDKPEITSPIDIASRHIHGSIAAFADGHVEWVKDYYPLTAYFINSGASGHGSADGAGKGSSGVGPVFGSVGDLMDSKGNNETMNIEGGGNNEEADNENSLGENNSSNGNSTPGEVGNAEGVADIEKADNGNVSGENSGNRGDSNSLNLGDAGNAEGIGDLENNGIENNSNNNAGDMGSEMNHDSNDNSDTTQRQLNINTKFTTYNLDVIVDDEFLLTDWVEKGSEGLGTQYVFIYVDGEKWHIDDFNSNNLIKINESDNKGGVDRNGEYRVYIVDPQSNEIIDHVTIRINDSDSDISKPDGNKNNGSGSKADTSKGNNGHGNNLDGVDMSNPGKAPFADYDPSAPVDDEGKGGGANPSKK